jgi:uncharacterized membrane protein
VTPASALQRARARTSRRFASYTFLGIVHGWVFLCLSLTPSLLPRSSVHQGVLSGIATAFGYGVGTGISKLWRYLGLPEPSPGHKPTIRRVSYVLLALALAWFLFELVRWQNQLRDIYGMESVHDVTFGEVTVLVGLAVAVLLVGLARLIARLVRWLVRWGERLLPARLGRVVGVAVGVLLVTFLINGVLIESMVRATDAAFSVSDAGTDKGVTQPTSLLRSGGPGSLVSWDSLGRAGRGWIAHEPTAADINELSGGGALEPIRVYVGRDSADSVEERAELAFRELIRTRAFERDVLVLATTTGSGGLDPNGTDSVEYMHNGNTAIVGLQYSFRPSWLSLYVDQKAAKEVSLVVFETIHDHWRDLDPQTRPAFYLFGVSLGSYGSEASSTSVRAISDPIDGAVWAGPTFLNEEWVALTENRDEGSPAWLPIYDEGSVVRFTGRENALDQPSARWGARRIVYIQHPSDPVSFFSFDLLLYEPEWLQGERSTEVSPDLNWYPGVTFWQVAMDLPMGGNVPPGYGHNLGASSYIDAWAAVTEPDGWTEAKAQDLKAHFAAR